MKMENKMRKANFLSSVVIFAVLMSVNSAYAFIEYIQAISYGWKIGKQIANKIEDRADREKISEINNVFGSWTKLQLAYMMESGKVGDCNTIGFKPPQTSNFSYECGASGRGGSLAFIRAESKRGIGDCPVGSTFKAEFDTKRGYVDIFFSSGECAFLENALTPQQKAEAAARVAQIQAEAEIRTQNRNNRSTNSDVAKTAKQANTDWKNISNFATPISNTWMIHKDPSIVGSITKLNSGVEFSAVSGSAQGYYLQLMQDGHNLRQGDCYLINMQGTTNASTRKIQIGFQKNSGSYDVYYADDFIFFNTLKSYTRHAYIKGSDSNARLYVNAGYNSSGNISISKLQITKKHAGMTQTQCESLN